MRVYQTLLLNVALCNVNSKKMYNVEPGGLYHPSFEHDACGIGFIANLKGSKSHKIVADALHMLMRMDHRGACGCEVNTGDGAGILLQIPHEFLADALLLQKVRLPALHYYGVGIVFFPKQKHLYDEVKSIFNRKIEELGLELITYRRVPVNNTMLGNTAQAGEPVMEQVFIKRPAHLATPEEFEKKLFVLNKYSTRIINEAVPLISNSFYIASLSCRTIVYKGQLTTEQLGQYFPDLKNEKMVSAMAVVHSRFSTNTFPSWRLAQPFRYLAHNGEINTVKGNVNWLRAQEALFESDAFTKEELEMLLPVCSLDQSDTANLDNAVEMLHLSGRSLPHVMMMLIPEAWDGHQSMDENKKAFYEYHASLMQPWDGPAAIIFTNGSIIGATLDRNGLRPSRYLVTKDDMVIMASEAGVLEIAPDQIVSQGRLQPGKMFIADLEQGQIVSDEEVKREICSQQPYKEWLQTHQIKLEELPEPEFTYKQPDEKHLLKKQIAFGFTSEDLKFILGPMATSGKEAVGSMGNDTPLAILSEQSQHLSSYFKQLFAQVTNPPIDSIREKLVMSLRSYVGGCTNLLRESPKHCQTLVLPQPILTNTELEKIYGMDQAHFQSRTIDIIFKADGKPGTLAKALNRICNYVNDAVDDGFSIIILSDRHQDSDHAGIPSLLATAAVHHHLIRKGIRGKVGLIIEAGDAWETHHFATLIGYGAAGVNPYMAFDTISAMKKSTLLVTDLEEEVLYKNYIKAVGGELLKIFSKMGISTLQSYQGAQIFEALGVSNEVIDQHFTGTVSRIGGLSLDDIARETLIKHHYAFAPQVAAPKLEVGGIYQWKLRGEFHLFNPQTIHLLQHSTQTNDFHLFKKYAALIDEQSRKACTLRSFFEFKPGRSVPLSEVEPVESIFKRFATGAMSFGSISHEAHTTLAIAMNRIGGKSNSGEGGEDEVRFFPKPNGDWERSAIKQVASGRFGVTSYYLANAEELQIKMAQGAKPGEGGQLPGHKVDEWIGRVRHSTPGVGLISPPPHHDIYSIEDLAQLIFDLKNANPEARISVKLVSESGVGTVAAGVAKAHADSILIAGHDGGTGASPLSSIRHAGMPWELGLAETHQTLIKNRLRGRVTLQTDGQIRTPKDLAVAAMLGAEEFGVATAALVTAGCIMMRKCHLNTCPVGIATQNEELRALFTGKPEHVVNLFYFLAEGLRELMAELGFRTINEMVGQADRLQIRSELTHWKHKNLQLQKILYREPSAADMLNYKHEEQDHGIADVLDRQLIAAAQPALTAAEPVSALFPISNLNRSTGTMLSFEVSKKYRSAGLPDGSIHFKFYGSAGQSFGAFGAKGLLFELHGEANDYFGKGLSGAQLVLNPSKEATFNASENIIVGNVALYGATSGEVYISGQAGERFAVRNSGAKAVVEAVGDHGCEYMTGGTVVVLGSTGRNFAAGMSGGVAYIYDAKHEFSHNCNPELVDLETCDREDEEVLRTMLLKHLQFTGSALAETYLNDWDKHFSQFIKVMPRDYKAALLKQKQQLNILKEVISYG
jgi:glutamate synthase (NADPH/NADH) large chain